MKSRQNKQALKTHSGNIKSALRPGSQHEIGDLNIDRIKINALPNIMTPSHAPESSTAANTSIHNNFYTRSMIAGNTTDGSTQSQGFEALIDTPMSHQQIRETLKTQ